MKLGNMRKILKLNGHAACCPTALVEMNMWHDWLTITQNQIFGFVQFHLII